LSCIEVVFIKLNNSAAAKLTKPAVTEPASVPPFGLKFEINGFC